MSAPVVDNYIAGIDGFLAQRATAITIAGLYLLKLFVPFGLVSDASWPQMQAYGFGDWQFLVSLLVFLAMIVFAVMKFKNKHPVAFGILYFFITFSIVSNIPFLIGTNYAERLLYTPSLGIFIAVAWVLHRFLGAPEERPATLKEYFTPQAKVVGVLCVPVIIYSGITVMRNPVWKDNQTLYGTDALISSESCKTHYLVANHWTMGDTLAYYAQTNPAERTRRIDTAIVEFRRAAELNPEFADALQRLGEMYHLKGQSDSAEACYRRAIWLLPQFATYRNNFGKMLFDLQRYEEAAYQFEMAVRFNPYYAAALNNLAGCYGTKASKYVQLAQSNPALAAEYNQKAVEWFQRSLQQSLKAIAVDPGFINAYETTAQTYALLGDNVSAQKYRTKAQELIKSGQGNRG